MWVVPLLLLIAHAYVAPAAAAAAAAALTPGAPLPAPAAAAAETAAAAAAAVAELVGDPDDSPLLAGGAFSAAEHFVHREADEALRLAGAVALAATPSVKLSANPIPGNDRNPSLWWVGVLLEFAGTFLTAAGKLMFRHAATSTTPVFWYALGCLTSMILYPFFDTGAYVFTSQQILSASGGLVITWNLVGATWVLGECLTLSRLVGLATIIGGVVCVAVFGNHLNVEHTTSEYMELLSTPRAAAFYCVMLGWVGFACWCLMTPRGAKFSGGAEARPWIISLLAGSVAGNMYVTKVAMSLLSCVFEGVGGSCGETSVSVLLVLALLLITAITHFVAVSMLAYALRTGQALVCIPAYEGGAMLMCAISSAMVLAEYTGMSPTHMTLYFGAVMLMLIGLMLLTIWPTRWFGDGERVVASCAPWRRKGGEDGLGEGPMWLERWLATESWLAKPLNELGESERAKLEAAKPAAGKGAP